MSDTMYRVVETMTCGVFDPVTTKKILWIGTDIEALKRDFPIDDILGDTLKPDEAGFISYTIGFERLEIGRVWVECDDPRLPVPDAEFKDIIDEEVELYNCDGLVLGRLGLWS
jgi:hypothetical protein